MRLVWSGMAETRQDDMETMEPVEKREVLDGVRENENSGKVGVSPEGIPPIPAAMAITSLHDDDDDDDEEGEGKGEGEGEVSGNTETENHYGDDDDEYGMDFNDYAEKSDDNEDSADRHSDAELSSIDSSHKADDGVVDHIREDDDDDFFDDSEDEGYLYDNNESHTAGLVIPDMGITREASLVSRLNGESVVFSESRGAENTSTLGNPTLQALSEEMRTDNGTSDHEFFMNAGLKKQNIGSDSEGESRTSTMTSDMTQRMEDMDINHSKFVSNVKYAESMISTEDNESMNDDAFSFLSNDDKKYEMGYDGSDDFYDEDDSDNYDNNTTNEDEDNDLTDTNATDTESIKTQDNETTDNTGSSRTYETSREFSNTDHFSDGGDAMRDQFVRSDMHPSILTTSTDLSESGESAIIPFQSAVSNLNNDENNRYNYESDSETIGGDAEELNEGVTDSDVPHAKIISFKDIPDVDLLGLFKNNKRADQNILTLMELRNDLDKVDSGLKDWISFNMGEGFKLGPEDEQKLGPHALEAIKNPKPIGTNIVGMNVNVTNVNANVNRVTDTVENTARKIGARGKTLLRKLRHSES